MVHAAVPDMSCSYDVVDFDDSKKDCTDGQTQDKSDLKKCHDCCFHCHVFLGGLTDNLIEIIIKNEVALTLHASLRSNDHSPLYRPPIV